MFGSPFAPKNKKIAVENLNTAEKISQNEQNNQIKKLQEDIKYLKNDLRDEQIEKWKLEEKIQELEQKIIPNVPEVKRNETDQIEELSILLKESRKQNLKYQEELAELRKMKSEMESINSEIEYLHDENRSLKSFIVAQNQASHYRRAFDYLTVEEDDAGHCSDCRDKENITELQEQQLEQTPQDQQPEQSNLIIQQDDENKFESNDNSSTSPPFQLKLLSLLRSNDIIISPISSDKKVQKRNSTGNCKHKRKLSNDQSINQSKPNSKIQQFPPINKAVMSQLAETCQISLVLIDGLAYAFIHIGDKLLVNIDSLSLEATVKYIGHLNDRYSKRLYLGIKLNTSLNNIPNRNRTDGTFNGRRYFIINDYTGYFIHISQITQIINKKTGQFEDFIEYFHKAIDPEFNRIKNSKI